MTNNRELSQIANLIEVLDTSKHINIKSQEGQNIGIGTTIPNAKVEVVGNVNVTGILTAQSIVSSNTNTLRNLNATGIITSVNVNVTGIATAQNLRVVGVSTFQNHAYFGDNDTLYFGDGNDLQIFHNGANNNSYITNAAANLYLISNTSVNIITPSGENSAIFNGNGSVELYHDNVKKFQTTAGGAIVTGILTATTLVGSVSYAASTGFSTTSSYATVAGLSTSATSATSATYAVTAGFATQTTYSTTSGVSTAVNGTVDVTLLRSAGISTFTNGPILIGSGTSTGTASQTLQVTGGAYVSNNLGIGTTNPTSRLFVTQSGTNPSTAGESGAHAFALSSGNTGRTMWMGYDDNIDAGYINVAKTGQSRQIYLQTRNLTNATTVFVGIGTTQGTGTANQYLQVGGGAYVSGNLGIGTTNPVEKFHVQGNSYFNGNVGFNTTIINGSTQVDFGNSNAYFGGYVNVGLGITLANVARVNFIGGVSNSGGVGHLLVTSNNTDIPTTIFSGSNGGRLSIFAGGMTSSSQRGGQIDFVGGASSTYPGELLFRTGIGTLGTEQPITARLDTSGIMYANTFTSTSDERLKANIERIDDPFVILNEVKGVRFNWKDGGDPSVGVIAQDVEKVLPEAVKTDPEGMKSVCYDMLIGVLIEAIKDQQKRIDDLEARLDAHEQL
jgi:hypothetical protein